MQHPLVNTFFALEIFYLVSHLLGFVMQAKGFNSFKMLEIIASYLFPLDNG